MDKNSKIIIVNIRNAKEEYAKCYHIIKLITQERLSEIQKKELLHMGEDGYVQIAGLDLPSVAPRYLEFPMVMGTEENFLLKGKHNLSEDDLNIVGERIRIHIRIKLISDYNDFDDSEMLNFLYLALLLKSIEKIIDLTDMNQRLLSVIILPLSGEKYPFYDNYRKPDYDTYKKISHYLRLLSYKYKGVIYGITKRKSQIVMEALDFHLHSNYEVYFPVLQIDSDRYDMLFNSYITDKIYYDLSGLKENSRYGNAGDKNPDVAFKDFVIETSYNNLKDKVKNVSKYIDELKKYDDISIMQFVLFCFIYNDNDNDFYHDIVKTYNLSIELSQGFRQIVQNATQHSDSKECFFSLFLHKSDIDEEREDFCNRIRKLYPRTQITNSGHDQRYEALEVKISDVNDKNDIIENFAINLQEELDLFKNDLSHLGGHNGLLKNRNKLKLRNFFSEFIKDDLLTEWRDFRNEDLVAHVGLSLFAITAQKCNCSFRVISCFLQALFGQSCKTFLDIIASPNWTKLQSLDWQLSCQPHSHCRQYLVVTA